ncbi:hypothetical protein BHE74_00049295, partial [Ensete ventricosum]
DEQSETLARPLDSVTEVMQPSGKDVQGMAAPHVALQELQNGGGGADRDDFFDQMISGLAPAWPPGLGDPKLLFGVGVGGKAPEVASATEGVRYVPYDESSLLASRLRQQEATRGGRSLTETSMLLQLGHHSHHQAQQQLLLQSIAQPPPAGGGDSRGFLPLPLSLGSGGSGDSGLLVDRSRDEVDAPFKSPHLTLICLLVGLCFLSVAQLRRERIAERMKALQELVPSGNKVRTIPSADKALMLDEIIDYVKFLQLQVKAKLPSLLTKPQSFPFRRYFAIVLAWRL